MGQVGDAVQLKCITYMYELANFLYYLQVSIYPFY